MVVKLIGGRVAYSVPTPWGDLPGIFGIGGTGATITTGGSQILKYVGIAGVSAVAGATLLGGSQALTQQQKQSGKAISQPIYHVAVEPGGTATFQDAGGSPAVEQTATQQAEQSKPDYMQYLLIGGLVIGAIYFLKGKK